MFGADGRPLPVGAIGEISIKGEAVFAGYEANPSANAAAFVGGWFRTGDQGRFDADGYLFITGRIKETINRGGEKISPREVDDALLEHPAVVHAAAFAVAHPTLGEDLVAAVVCDPGRTLTEAQLRGFLFNRLAEFKIPSRIVFVDAIPKSSTGKIQRAALHVALREPLAGAYEPPDDQIERVVAEVMQQVLDIPAVGQRDNFFALGGDSLSGARVVARTNEQLGVDMRVTELFRHPTVAEFANQVRVARQASPD